MDCFLCCGISWPFLDDSVFICRLVVAGCPAEPMEDGSSRFSNADIGGSSQISTRRPPFSAPMSPLPALTTVVNVVP